MYSPETFSDLMEEVDRRLRQLESSGRIGNVTLKEGAFEVRDSDGEVRVRIGFDPDTGDFLGVSVRADDGTWARLDVLAAGRRLGLSDDPVEIVGTASGWATATGPDVSVVTSTGQILVQSTVTLSEIGYDAVIVGTEIVRLDGSVAAVTGETAGNGTTVCPALMPSGFPYPVVGLLTVTPGIYRVRHRYRIPAGFTAHADAVVMTVTPS